MKVLPGDLILAARKAAEKAYAPYSKVKVGAALLTDIGVFTAANIENASYSLTMCAERIAIFKAINNGAKEFMAMAVHSPNLFPVPCGACLQVMAEFAGEDFVIIVDGAGMSEEYTLRELLPKRFSLSIEK